MILRKAVYTKWWRKCVLHVYSWFPAFNLLAPAPKLLRDLSHSIFSARGENRGKWEGWQLLGVEPWVAPRCATEAFSTTCAVHIEDCEGWWWSATAAWASFILWHSFVPLYILSYLVANIQYTTRGYHKLWKDTTEPTIELICLRSAAWATALIYTKGPMTAAAQNGYSRGEVPGWLHTMYHAGVYSLYSKCYTLQHCHWTLKHGFTNICNRDM